MRASGHGGYDFSGYARDGRSADGEDSERYSVDEYLGTACGAGDAVIKDEVCDFTKALVHFADSRYSRTRARRGRAVPQQGIKRWTRPV